jgi:4-hydroxy-tetrahydrodipicolinate reductase
MRLLINGICGQMGKALVDAVKQDPDYEIVGGVDPNSTSSFPFPVYSSCKEVTVEADAVIDFSVPKATEQILNFAIEHKLPLVICTTALPDSLLGDIREASKTIPIFRSGNMSLGINVMRALLMQAKTLLGDAFDVEIVETHHNRKIDAPSGTALMLADAICEADNKRHPYVLGRSEKDRRRERGEIGFHSVRGGTVVGEHEVRFLGPDEELSVLHRAYSKRIFANGALKAASYLLKKQNGLYSMEDLVNEMLG